MESKGGNFMSKQASLWSKTFVLIMLANAFNFFAFDILLPTLPLYLAGQGGMSASEIGLVLGSFTFSAVAVRPFTTALTDRWGRKPVLLGAILICLSATLGYYAAHSFWLALSLRILHGFGLGLSITILTTLAAELIPSERRGEGMGMIGNGTTIALAISPFAGMWLIRAYDPVVLFIVAGGSAALYLLCVCFLSFPAQPNRERKEASSVLGSLIEPAALFPSGLLLLLGTCMSGIMSFMALYGSELHISGIAWFYFANTISAFCVRFLSGRAFDRFGPPWVILPSALLMMLGFVLISGATTLRGLVIAACVYGMGQGALFPSMQAWALNSVKPERFTTVTAMFYNSLDIGLGGGAALMGVVASHFGFSNLYRTSAGIMLVFFLIYAGMVLGKRQKALQIERGV